jgi:hypothetical protein
LNWSDFEGRCLFASVKWYELDAAELVNLCYSMLLGDIISGEISRTEARTEFEKRLNDYKQTTEIKKGIKPEAEPFKLSPAMMSQMGVKVHKPKPKAEQDSQ